ncbi:hypothetical protein AKO1_000410, partial [Acrasis kona]
EKNLQSIINQRRHTILLGPSQSGKSSRVILLRNVLNNSGEYLCFYTSALYMAENPKDLFEQFKKQIKNQLLQLDQKYKSVEFNNYGELFDNEKIDKKMVLIIDEIDALGADTIDALQRQAFLTAIKNQRDNLRGGLSAKLVSSIAVSNVFGTYVNDTLGSSPYNITDVVNAPFFTLEETKDLFAQYEEETGCKLDPLIIRAIFDFTNGAPGLTSILGQQLDLMRQNLKKIPNAMQWCTFLNSRTCVNNILRTPNYSLMWDHLTANKEAFQVIFNTLKNRQPLGAIEKANLDYLQKINVVRVVNNDVEVSNPFVLCLIAYITRKDPPPHHKTPVLFDAKGTVNVKMLVQEAVRLMNPTDVIIHEKQKSNNHCSKCPPGYKEKVYISAFRKALDLLLSNQSVYYYKEEEPVPGVTITSCDSVILLSREKIGIEHAATVTINLTVSAKTAGTLMYHINTQARTYKEELKLDQMWVIDWTNVESKHTGHASDKIYHFPKNDFCNLIYIHHDDDFKTLNIHYGLDDVKTIKLEYYSVDEAYDAHVAKKRKFNEVSNIVAPRDASQSGQSGQQQRELGGGASGGGQKPLFQIEVFKYKSGEDDFGCVIDIGDDLSSWDEIKQKIAHKCGISGF